MSAEFRIVLIGQAAFGEAVLNALLERGENVVGVWCPPVRAAADPLKTAADRHRLPVFQYRRMRDSEAIAAFKALNADLGVMAFVTDIVPDAIIEAPTHGTINFHPSLLPKYRGPSSINWPIIEGVSETGLSIFWPDAGLDTGPILLQKKVAIEAEDTLGTLYFNKIFPLGVASMVEAVELVREGRALKIPQDHSQASYQSWCKAEQSRIDWRRPVVEVYNLIRGTDPSPGANTQYNGTPIKIFNASRCPQDALGEPGAVIGVSTEGISIAAVDGAITVGRIQPEGAKKIAAADWAAEVNLRPGDRFGD